MMQAEAGKGSKPRKQQDHDAYATNYDRIFAKKAVSNVETMLKKIVGDDFDYAKNLDSIWDFVDTDPEVCDLLGYVKLEVDSVRRSRIVDGYYLCVVDYRTHSGPRIIVGAFPIIDEMGDIVIIDTDSGNYIKMKGQQLEEYRVEWSGVWEKAYHTTRTIVDFE